MPYGNYSQNNQKKGPYDPTVYSAYKFNNAMSAVDKTQLSCQFWNDSLRIMIAPRNADSPDDQPTFDTKNSISIYLNYMKARMLADVLRKFLEDPEKYDNTGVVAGSSVISFTTGKDFSSKFPMVIIRKVDESGNITSSFAYEVKGDYYFSIQGFTEKSNGQYDQNFYPEIELQCLLTLLEEFYKAQTKATAYSVLDAFKYDQYRMSMKINRIGEKLGLDMNVSSNGSAPRSSSTSYFSRNNGASSSSGSSESYGSGYTSATLDDLMEE